ncbi:hypothetical protein [Larkinella arboricola]
MQTLIETPTLQEQQVARELIVGLSPAMQGRSDQVTIQSPGHHPSPKSAEAALFYSVEHGQWKDGFPSGQIARARRYPF